MRKELFEAAQDSVEAPHGLCGRNRVADLRTTITDDQRHEFGELVHENQPGGAPAVISAMTCGRERFDGSAELAEMVTLGGVNYSILGVALRRFRLNENSDV